MRKLSISKIIFPVVFSVLFLFVSLTLFGCSFEEFIGYIDEQLKFPEYYTNDIADYGNFKDITDENADYFIRSFFPDKIENDFQDVVYSYTVVPYGCEVYLEFTFSTDAKFYDHLDKVAYDKMRQTFYFDTDFYWFLILFSMSFKICFIFNFHLFMSLCTILLNFLNCICFI